MKKTILPAAQVAAELAHDGKACEMQMLKNIRHLKIQEMLNQL
ncbi:hypothetical protein [Alishewanella agri]|nr:hypothetical protein [Alishewanella agri]